MKSTEQLVAQQKRQRKGFATQTYALSITARPIKQRKVFPKNDKHILGLFLRDVHRLHNHKSSRLN